MEQSDFNDLEKTMESGAFFDLNQEIAKDSSFTMKNYIPSLMEVCRQGDKLPLLPIVFSSSILITSQETLSKTGFKITEGQSLDTFLESIEQYCSQADTRQPLAYFTPGHLFFIMLDNSGIPILDYDKKSVTLDSVPFRQLAQTYKVLYVREQNVSEADRVAPQNSTRCLLNGGALFTYENGGYGICMACIEITMAGQTSILFPVPSSSNSLANGMLKPKNLAGISQGSPNKLNAYNMLKILLNNQIQNPQSNSYQQHTMCLDDLPYALNFLAYRAINNLNCQGKGAGANNELLEKVRTDVVKQTQTLLANAPATLGLSEAVKDILWEEMEPYFQGSRSLDEAMASAQEKLQLYIGE